MSNEAIQQSLRDESQRIEDKERMDKEHKTAFRVAFNFLTEHYPAQDTEEYWKLTCADISIASGENIDNRLCQELLGAVLNYLAAK